jgi:hypothetical protein
MAYTTIDDPSVYFQIKLYTAAGAYTFDGNSDMQPDWMWIKELNGTNEHNLFDSVRGVTNGIESSTNAAQFDRNTTLTAFGSDGFTVGNNGGTGQNGGNYVGWGWKVNGSGSENTVGDLTVTALSVNQTAGISIGKITDGFTSTSSNSETVGHGLGAIPQVIIVKNTEATGDWQVYHVGIGNTKKIRLNSTGAGADSTLFDNTTPTSSVWSVRGGDFATGEDVVFYAFAEKQGYSKFGNYLGTAGNNGDAPFIYTGFKPSWFMVKNASATSAWEIYDSKSLGYNDQNHQLRANANDALSAVSDYVDFVSNGIKIRHNSTGINEDGDNFIYMAFAENPFVTSTGVPATAR